MHQVAATAGISIITLSSDASLAGPGVYAMGFTPDVQIKRVIGYAVLHCAHIFAALTPNGAYGTLVGRAFETSVSSMGGTVTALETFRSHAA